MENWNEFLNSELRKPYLVDSLDYIKKEREKGIHIYPEDNDIFNAFKLTDLRDIKVVILGQDPYHGPNQAHGLCFSVLPEIKIPPSLRNIYKELQSDIDKFVIPDHGYLQFWARQGVFLLNTVLTVEEGKAHSHKNLGWETFTDRVIQIINDELSNIVFLLWGTHAQNKCMNIDESKHHILKASHPSPLSAYRGFFGCKHFSKTNDILTKNNKKPINWHISNESSQRQLFIV